MMNVRKRLSELRREEYEDTWPAVRDWLGEVETSRLAATRMRHAPRGRAPLALRSALAAGLFLLAVAACALPVRREETIGYVLRLRALGTPTEVHRRLAQFPWSRRGMLMAMESGAGTATTLWFAAPNVEARQAEHWAQQAGALPGTRVEAVEPIRDVVTRPAYAVAARALFGTSFGGELSEEELERRVFEQLSFLTPGSVAIKVDDEASGGADLYMLPQKTGPTARPIVVHSPGTEQVVLMVLRRRSGGSPDTVLVPLDAAAYVGKSEAERAAAVEQALRARGVDGVEVEFKDGGVWVRSTPPKPSRSPAAARP